MRKFIALAAVVPAAAVSGPVLAQDVQSTFSGPRVEAIIGYDVSRSGSSVDIDDVDPGRQQIDGLMYGAGVGFDFAISDGVVFGVEGEFTDSTAKYEFGGTPNDFVLGQVEAGRDIYVGGRLGAVIGSSTLAYVKGGYTNARYNFLATDGTTNVNQRLDLDGWRAGAGIEQAIGENAFAKIEYRYSNYTEGEFDFNDTVPDSGRFDLDTDRHQIVASVGLRF